MRDKIVGELNKVKFLSMCNIALKLTNAKREFDTTNSTIAYDLKDKMERIFKSNGLEVYRNNQQLILKIGNLVFKVSCYNNKKLNALRSDYYSPKQLNLLDTGRGMVSLSKIMELGFTTDKFRKNFSDIFLMYYSINGEKCYTSLLAGTVTPAVAPISEEKPMIYTPKFIKPAKKSEEKLPEIENK